ncbi:spore coat protein [Bacillus sp. CGMCC 1.16541]|uniref:spore coat protein n=1 Tax=Bacillus sp. CGMCC 1.16541 TaxID=2185143 RepID=UPI0013A58776|nr:spore coat protein [Bacillus sp. CGMCC 1.16541]
MNQHDFWFGTRNGRGSQSGSRHGDSFSLSNKGYSEVVQNTHEEIYVKDSTNVAVLSIDAKAALSLQAALQAAISAIISLSLLDDDDDTANHITQELLGVVKTKQYNYQKTYIEGSDNVLVATIDLGLVVNLQILLQLLLLLIVELDIL